MKKETQSKTDAFYQKKEAITQKKVMKLLRKGDIATLDQIKLEYFYLIDYLLKIVMKQEIAKEVSNKAYKKFIEQKNIIQSRENMLDIIFQEVINAIPKDCAPSVIRALKKEMTALKNVYLQIEKIHPAYKPIIRMAFRRETMIVMQTELDLNMEDVATNRELGIKLLIKGLQDEKKKRAEILFTNVIYELLLFSETL